MLLADTSCNSKHLAAFYLCLLRLLVYKILSHYYCGHFVLFGQAIRTCSLTDCMMCELTKSISLKSISYGMLLPNLNMTGPV